jgi:hypothetical protein
MERIETPVTAGRDRSTTPEDAVFHWHPDYQGRRVDAVTRELEAEIARDQRSYELALMGAEESEHDALASVVDVERRWSRYDFGWNEVAAPDLARRIAEFEWAREQRQEMISWHDYRATGTPASGADRTGRADWRASMSDGQRRRVANVLALVMMALIVVAIVVVLVLVL